MSHVNVDAALTNGEVVDWLLSGTEGAPPVAPDQLADWASAIPGFLLRGRVQREIWRRYAIGRSPRLYRSEPMILQPECWHAAPFSLPPWTFDPVTGRRMLPSPPYTPDADRPEGAPRKTYRMPVTLPASDYWAWMRGDPPYADRETYAAWFDEDMYEYVFVAGRLMRRNDIENG